MTFIEWCNKDPEDEHPMKVTLSSGKVYEPYKSVPIEDVNHLKRLDIIGNPILVNDIWQVLLQDD